MRVIDPGHEYALRHLDDDGESMLRFVKREGVEYPGNVGSHPGTTTQEVLRALIARTQYVNRQAPHPANLDAIYYMRATLVALEIRASERHGLSLAPVQHDAENAPTCPACGHIQCKHGAP